jgi:SRSO17 transposase
VCGTAQLSEMPRSYVSRATRLRLTRVPAARRAACSRGAPEVRRLRSCSRTSTDEFASYLVYAPAGTAPAAIVQVAGLRWSVEDFFNLAKGQVGLDHYEVRCWQGWYRHMTLALWALVLLAVEAARATRMSRAVTTAYHSACPNFAAS